MASVVSGRDAGTGHITCLYGAIPPLSLRQESYKIGAYHRTENENVSVDRHVKWDVLQRGASVTGTTVELLARPRLRKI